MMGSDRAVGHDQTSRTGTAGPPLRSKPRLDLGHLQMGLARMMRSQSFRAFAEALAGRRLRSGWGLQVLRYGPGDYAGPHNDHHPENAAAKGGYIDLHLSLCTPGVEHQWLVYSRAGHFSEIVSVASPSTVTAYRLPFWHYTTPLVGTPQGRALGIAGNVPVSLTGR
jgi:hypothetical protein